MPVTPQVLLHTKEKLAAIGHSELKAVIGFDGFVDEICAVVDKRISATNYTPINTIAAYGERISKAAGLSTNIELVPKVVKLGGNGPIMANALSSLGLNITYIGALGKPTIHPVFTELAAKAQVYSIANPAHTDALEFSDGKVMVGKLESLKDVNWANLIAAIPLPQLVQIFRSTQLLAAVNWTMIPYMTDLWQSILSEVAAPENCAHRPLVFFDLADPEKRATTELLQALDTIKRFNLSCRAVLGLNRKEASEIAEALGLKLSTDATQAPLAEITQAIAENLNLYGLVVHPTTMAACVVANEFALVEGPYTSHPKLTTGAGDNFNAGFCYGLTLGFSAQGALLLGTGTSGYYVRNGRSPARAELASFLALWAQNVGSEF